MQNIYHFVKKAITLNQFLFDEKVGEKSFIHTIAIIITIIAITWQSPPKSSG